LLEYTLAYSPIRKNPRAEPLSALGGHVKVPDKSGWGIEVNPEMVARNHVSSS
jgi:L-alanine-DL-glutamate epimerase-like enolase superfamily enzyme